jgi:hypothetical protein
MWRFHVLVNLRNSTLAVDGMDRVQNSTCDAERVMQDLQITRPNLVRRLAKPICHSPCGISSSPPDEGTIGGADLSWAA